jgi:hypothetical protein
MRRDVALLRFCRNAAWLPVEASSPILSLTTGAGGIIMRLIVASIVIRRICCPGHRLPTMGMVGACSRPSPAPGVSPSPFQEIERLCVGLAAKGGV